MMRISKLPLPDDAKEQLLAKEYVLTIPFAVLGMILLAVAGWINLDKFILLWWAAAILAAFALALVSGRSRGIVAVVLASLTVSFFVIEFIGYRDIASFVVAGGSGATMLFANYLGRRDFVRNFQVQQAQNKKASDSFRP